MGVAATRKLNIDVTPEQEAEIAWLKDVLHADTVKGTVFTSVRLTSQIVAWLQQGGELCIREADGGIRAVALPGIPKQPTPTWRYLTRRPGDWREQLWVKGRKLLASDLWRDTLANGRSPEEAAGNWDLPLEAVREALSYCEANQELLALEAEEEARRSAQIPMLKPAPRPRRGRPS